MHNRKGEGVESAENQSRGERWVARKIIKEGRGGVSPCKQGGKRDNECKKIRGKKEDNGCKKKKGRGASSAEN